MTTENESKTNIYGRDIINSNQTALLLALVIITSKLCLLPSVVSKISGESAFISIAVSALLDIVIGMISFAVSRKGGLRAVKLPKPLKLCVSALLLILFSFKFFAFSFELSSSAAASLFDDPVILPVFALVTACVVYVGSKGFGGIMRMGSLLFWAILLLLIFNLFFLGVDGDPFNLLPIARGNDVLEGTLRSCVWFGDTSILLFIDTSSSKGDKKGTALITASMILATLVVLGFYLLMIYTYGSALQYVENAFSRVLLMRDNTAELGAIDWPITTVWLIMSFLHCSLLVASVKRCAVELSPTVETKPWVKTLFYVLLPAISFLFYYFIFKNTDNYLKTLTSLPVAITVAIVEYASPVILCSVMLVKRKRGVINEQEKG